jgi:hypothetical protein
MVILTENQCTYDACVNITKLRTPANYEKGKANGGIR